MTERGREVSETGRRTFLRRSGAALFGVGLGARRMGTNDRRNGANDRRNGANDRDASGAATPDTDGGSSVYMLLADDGSATRDVLHDVVLITETTRKRLDPGEIGGCREFVPFGLLNGYRGLVVDRTGIERLFRSGKPVGVPVSETNVFVSVDQTGGVEAGSAYVITGSHHCAEDYVAVTTHRLTEQTTDRFADRRA